jgi:uncharacterized surface protein with fasciclin (FAS1) repeats
MGEEGMLNRMLMITTALAFAATAACSQHDGNAASGETKAQTSEAKKVAGDKTIAAGLTGNAKFLEAAKAAGLDQTLAGPGPYTVFAPDDAAFTAAGSAVDAKPDNRAALTGTLTNLILPGTVLAADIGKAIDSGKGKAVLATMGGGTLTATKDGDKIVLADASGHKATVTKADDQFTNGVVHHIDALLMPKAAAGAPPAVGSKVGG